MIKRDLKLIVLLFLLVANEAYCRIGLSFTFQNMPKTQMIFEGRTYRIRPGIGFNKSLNKYEYNLIIDNEFILKPYSKLNPFLGLGIVGTLRYDRSKTWLSTRQPSIAIEPNFGLQYNFNENFSVFGDVRLSGSYSGYDGMILEFGKTEIGLMFYK